MVAHLDTIRVWATGLLVRATADGRSFGQNGEKANQQDGLLAKMQLPALPTGICAVSIELLPLYLTHLCSRRVSEEDLLI